jgi:SAM-dependent methyltransferase
VGGDGVAHYVIRGGAVGRERLRVLARVMWPTTAALLDEVGVAPDARCLDMGCGGGDVTVQLARRVPQGHVVGADLDPVKLQAATAEAADAGITNVSYRSLDVTAAPGAGGTDAEDPFDLIYVRFVLTHLPDPERAVAGLRDRLAPGGVLVAEDIDFRGHFCHPPLPAFDRYVELYRAAARARGCDPDIGPRLPGFLHDAGLEDRRMRVVQPAGFEGEVKQVASLTLEATADAIVSGGLSTADEIAGLVDELDAFARADGTVMSLPRVVQVWGRRA